MDWYAPVRVMRGLVRPAGALLLVAGAVTGGATVLDRPASDPDHPRFRNAFDVEQVQSDAVLGQASDRTARLTVTERIRGAFEGGHQLVRVIPATLAGHRMPVTVLGVTGPGGSTAKWHAAPEDDAVVLRITGGPLVGGGTYTVTYRRDGVVVGTDTGARVVWDVKAGAWPEAAAVTGTLRVPGALAAAADAPSECAASGATCRLTSGTTVDGARTYATTEVAAATDDEVLVDVGVAPGLFALNEESATGPGNAVLAGVGAGALVLAGAGAALAASRRRRGSHEAVDLLASVVPESLSPAMAGSLLGSPGRGIVGQLLAATVTGHVRLRSGDADALVELVEWPGGLTPEAEAALSVLAPRTPGEARSVTGGVRLATEATLAQVRDAPERTGLVRRPDRASAARRLALLGLGAAVAIPAYAHTQDASFLAGTGSLLATLVALGVGYGTLHQWQSFTARGREALGQLEGLARYLKLPRQHRITFLHNASGEEIADSHEALTYQQLLPYAAVLGLVGDWRQRVAESLGSEPGWLPMEQLDLLFTAVDAGTIAERLDGVLMPVEGRTNREGTSLLAASTIPAWTHVGGGMGAGGSSGGAYGQ